MMRNWGLHVKSPSLPKTWAAISITLRRSLSSINRPPRASQRAKSPMALSWIGKVTWYLTDSHPSKSQRISSMDLNNLHKISKTSLIQRMYRCRPILIREDTQILTNKAHRYSLWSPWWELAHRQGHHKRQKWSTRRPNFTPHQNAINKDMFRHL